MKEFTGIAGQCICKIAYSDGHCRLEVAISPTLLHIWEVLLPWSVARQRKACAERRHWPLRQEGARRRVAARMSERKSVCVCVCKCKGKRAMNARVSVRGVSGGAGLQSV